MALQLAQAEVNLVGGDFEAEITAITSDEFISRVIQTVPEVDPGEVMKVMKEIQISEQFSSHKFLFWIRKHHGSMSLVALRAKQENSNVQIKWSSLRANVALPTLYTTITTTHKGSRRYLGIVGPKKHHHHTKNIARALTSDEILKVENHLREAIQKDSRFLAITAQ